VILVALRLRALHLPIIQFHRYGLAQVPIGHREGAAADYLAAGLARSQRGWRARSGPRGQRGSGDRGVLLGPLPQSLLHQASVDGVHQVRFGPRRVRMRAEPRGELPAQGARTMRPLHHQVGLNLPEVSFRVGIAHSGGDPLGDAPEHRGNPRCKGRVQIPRQPLRGRRGASFVRGGSDPMRAG
jgi:hypothetical protein